MLILCVCVCAYIHTMIPLLTGKPHIFRLWFLSQDSFPGFSYPCNTTYKKCDYKVPVSGSQRGVSQFFARKMVLALNLKRMSFRRANTDMWEFVSCGWHSVRFPSLCAFAFKSTQTQNELLAVCVKKSKATKLIT